MCLKSESASHVDPMDPSIDQNDSSRYKSIVYFRHVYINIFEASYDMYTTHMCQANTDIEDGMYIKPMPCRRIPSGVVSCNKLEMEV
jgi:hypothetical protein